MGTPLRIVVVDDSALVIEALTAVLEEDPELTVVGFASNGREAADLVERLRPDLVTMDVQMPVMGGLDAVERIMARTPTRIVVITDDPRGRGGELVFEALARGALEVVPKLELLPGTRAAAALREKVKLLATVPLRSRADRAGRPMRWAAGGPDPAGVVGVVASTGGPALLESILAALPAGFAASVLVVQHIAEGFTPKLASWLARVSALDVEVARGGERMRRGAVYLAPDGAQLTVDAAFHLRVDPDAAFHDGHRPSGTVLLKSIARCFARRGGGLVLTGMGKDGCEGLAELRQAGGWTAAQDPDSSVVDGMPRAARESGAAAEVLTPGEIVGALTRLAARWEAG